MATANSFSINFKTQELANLYLGTGTTQTELISFRTGGSADVKEDLAALDNRIAAFQAAISDGSGIVGTEDYPYDKAYLKREFMNEVLAALLRRGGYARNLTNVYFGNLISGSVSPVTSSGLLTGKVYAAVRDNPGEIPAKYSQGALIWDGGNFDNMTVDQVKNGLTADGGAIYDAYSAWIDAVFVEGNKLKNNPIDPGSGVSIVSNVVTSVTERTYNGVVYDRVTSEPVLDSNGKQVLDANGDPKFKTYLIAKGAQMYEGLKVTNNGYLANATDGTVMAGPAIDTSIGLTPNLVVPGPNYLEVDKDTLTPLTGAVAVTKAQRTLSPMWYLYYWNEARIKVLRGKLNYLDAVTSEIKDDLIKANKAYSDLEAQAGKVRNQSADGKETNPDATAETAIIDFFEATNSTISQSGTQLFNTEATSVLKQADKSDRQNADSEGGDSHNYTQWQSNRSALKSYIDRKSTDAQRATQDYQGLLNKFNSAYEIMSKLQEKLDSLVKTQLRNV